MEKLRCRRRPGIRALGDGVGIGILSVFMLGLPLLREKSMGLDGSSIGDDVADGTLEDGVRSSGVSGSWTSMGLLDRMGLRSLC